MHLVDSTMFFSNRGGGVKQYLLAKHALLRAHTCVRHTLLVPNVVGEAECLRTVGGAAFPLEGGYKFPLSVSRWRDALLDLAPDIIEAGDPYIAGLAAREVR